MTLTALEPRIVELPDIRPACEGKPCLHDGTATLALYTACSCLRLCCLPCRDDSREIVDRRWRAEQKSWACPVCKTELHGYWAQIVASEVPL